MTSVKMFDGNAKSPTPTLRRYCCWPDCRSVWDANLLKIEATYGYRLSCPDRSPLIATAMVADPANARYYQADPIRSINRPLWCGCSHRQGWVRQISVKTTVLQKLFQLLQKFILPINFIVSSLSLVLQLLIDSRFCDVALVALWGGVGRVVKFR